jgi:hypothetical protein
VHGMPPLPSLHGECEACDWHLMHRVIPAHCPRCGRPTHVVSLDDMSGGVVPHEDMAARRGGIGKGLHELGYREDHNLTLEYGVNVLLP